MSLNYKIVSCVHLIQKTESDLHEAMRKCHDLEMNKRNIMDQNKDLVANYEEIQMKVREYVQKW